ncbi:MAG: sigma-70 family RNA polymerase sigma factor, partial [Bacteroidota bacterium]
MKDDKHNRHGNLDPTPFTEFEAEALPHMDAMYNFAYRLTGNSDDANDLVQETYLKAFRFFDKFERGTNIKAWLYRITKNSFINDYRKNKKEPDKVDYEDIQNFYENIKSSEVVFEHVEEDPFGKLMDDDVASAMANLPDDFRTVIIL